MTKFPEGIRFYNRSEKAPDFILGKIKIEPKRLSGQMVLNVCMSEKDPFDIKYYVGFSNDSFIEPKTKGSDKYPAGISYIRNLKGEPKWIMGWIHVDADVLTKWTTEDVIFLDIKKSKDSESAYLQLNTWKPTNEMPF